MTSREIRLSEPLSSSCLPAYHPGHGLSARRQGGPWFTKQTLTSEAHLNCSYALVMTFYNLWWEGEGSLDSVLETKRKTRRREGNRVLIMFLKHAYGTCQHYRNMISLMLIIALLVPLLRRGNWRNELSKELAHSVNELETSGKQNRH